MRNGVRRGEVCEGRKVKFVHLLGAALNTGIINVIERRALAEHSLLFKGHLWVLERGKSGKRGRERRGQGWQSDSINEKLSWEQEWRYCKKVEWGNCCSLQADRKQTVWWRENTREWTCIYWGQKVHCLHFTVALLSAKQPSNTRCVRVCVLMCVRQSVFRDVVHPTFCIFI